MLVLDGAYGEGGGQILRTALVLSLLTGQSFRMDDIRHGRPKPGLKAQHLHILHALGQMSDAQIGGAELGARTVTFQPGHLRGGHYHTDIGTAGAIPLFLQTILPAAMFADGPVTGTITGGTDVRGAMTMDFWQSVLLPLIRPYAQHVAIDVQRRGYYPKGGGRVKFTVVPRFAQTDWASQHGVASPLDLPSRGNLKHLLVHSRASSHLRERRVAERQAQELTKRVDLHPCARHVDYGDAYSTGSSITAVAIFEHCRLGVDALGARRKTAEQVGRAAARRLNDEVASGATVDVHTADNLMLWLALFDGAYRTARITGHMETNAWVINQFLPGAINIAGTSIRS